MKKLTLIGGAPMTGKTTLSRQMAEVDGAVELSTDSIRSWLKKIVRENDYPDLFYADNMTAEEFYDMYAVAQSVVEGEVAEGKQVQKGIIALLETAITWKHLVIEGIAITPSFMKELQDKYSDRELEFIILVDQKKQRIEERIRGRGLWGPLDTYSASLIPREVEWVILYNEWYLEQAKRFNIPVRFV